MDFDEIEFRNNVQISHTSISKYTKYFGNGRVVIQTLQEKN